ncbi:uncharacterized protein Dana_GF17369, isoform C [Drosophila ananassae]|uniref:Uncharacterized protein, isoform C n=1 Tax=Drosophila ananassae TaxID=7217 RepID=B3LXA4_DROAN|nr:RNA-binding protein Musashi homolog 1 isoform X2 [Drosophila ananassae]EDV41704.2 uncharacterized protein Dana_GF17369, isoform C [Drosophila ananassae]
MSDFDIRIHSTQPLSLKFLPSSILCFSPNYSCRRPFLPKMDNNCAAGGSCQFERKASSRNNVCVSSTDPVGTANNPPNGAEGDEHLRKIFIGGLSTQTTVETVREFFRQFGAVADAVVMRDPMTNHSRGFGFVTYVDGNSVENVQRAGPHSIDNKTVETKRALPRHEFLKPGGGAGNSIGAMTGVKSNKIFLGGLKDCHDESSIREYFSQFGGITSVKLLLDKDTGRKRGFGFLEFEDSASADQALAQGKHTINMTTVEVKKSTQKPDPGKRLRFPVGGAARAGYIPPQPASLDSYNYSSSTYNPYLAQTVLPPSAFINGWASYVTPEISPPTNPVLYAAKNLHQAPQPPHLGYACYQPETTWPAYQKHGNHEWTPSNVGEWPPKAGHKHAQTSTNDSLEAKSDPGARGDADGAGTVVPVAVTTGKAKKWPTDDYKIFKPAQRLNSKVGNGGTLPAYGI